MLSCAAALGHGHHKAHTQQPNGKDMRSQAANLDWSHATTACADTLHAGQLCKLTGTSWGLAWTMWRRWVTVGRCIRTQTQAGCMQVEYRAIYVIALVIALIPNAFIRGLLRWKASCSF